MGCINEKGCIRQQSCNLNFILSIKGNISPLPNQDVLLADQGYLAFSRTIKSLVNANITFQPSTSSLTDQLEAQNAKCHSDCPDDDFYIFCADEQLFAIKSSSVMIFNSLHIQFISPNALEELFISSQMLWDLAMAICCPFDYSLTLTCYYI